MSKILIVSQYFYPEGFKINDIANSLVEKGEEVIVLTSYPNYPEGKFLAGYKFWRVTKEEIGGATVIRVPQISRGSKKSFRLVLNYFSFSILLSVLGPFLLRKHSIKSVFVYQLSPALVLFPAMLIAGFKSAKLIYWITDLWPETLRATGVVKSKFWYSIWTKIMSFLHRGADTVLVSCKGFMNNLEQQGVDRSRMQYWPQWAEDLFGSTEGPKLDEELTTLPEGFKILFAGNIGSSQSFDTILDAAEIVLSKNKKIHWLVLGSGVQEEWVKKEIEERRLGSNFHMLGRRPIEYMPAFYSEAHVLLASLNADPLFSITVPAKIQSYLASSKPILLSMDGEAAEIIRSSKAGLVCPAGNSIKLAEAALKMSAMQEEEREEMGRRGREFFNKNFNKEKLLNQLICILN